MVRLVDISLLFWQYLYGLKQLEHYEVELKAPQTKPLETVLAMSFSSLYIVLSTLRLNYARLDPH